MCISGCISPAIEENVKLDFSPGSPLPSVGELRKGAYFYNDGGGVIYLKLGTSPSTSSSLNHAWSAERINWLVGRLADYLGIPI